MSTRGDEQDLVAYFEEMLAAELAGRREAEGVRLSSTLEATEPAVPAEEEISAKQLGGAHSASPATALREVFSRIRLGGSRTAGLGRPLAPLAAGHPPSGGRPGDGLRALFNIAAVGGGTAALPAVAPLAVPATTGVAELDRCLGAGFPPGLWFVTADEIADAAAFIEAAIWEAATRQRPVLYLALTGGKDAVRKRFQIMLGHVLGYDRELDSILRRTVLRHVRFVGALELVDSVIAGTDPVGVFLRDLDSVVAGLTSRDRTAPVVAIDDLTALLRFLGAPSKAQTARALEGMDAVLRRRRAPGLITAGPDVAPARAGSGQVELHRRTAPYVQSETLRMRARVVDHSPEGRPCTIGLAYHRSVGMFAAAG